MQVNVDTVETDQEVGKDILLGLGDVSKKGGNEGFSVWESSVDGHQQLESFGVDITDFNTTFAGLSAVVQVYVRLSGTHWVKRIQSPSRAELIQT